MKKDVLELLKLVSDANTHLLQLKTLIAILQILSNHDSDYNVLVLIAKTTLNSHYDYRLYNDPMFQDPKNHVNEYIDKRQLKKGYITAIEPAELNYSYSDN